MIGGIVMLCVATGVAVTGYTKDLYAGLAAFSAFASVCLGLYGISEALNNLAGSLQKKSRP